VVIFNIYGIGAALRLVRQSYTPVDSLLRSRALHNFGESNSLLTLSQFLILLSISASYCILTRGHLVRFRIRRATAYHHKQKNHSLQQAYVSRWACPGSCRLVLLNVTANQVYAGLLAQNEVTSKTREDAWNGEPRVYQDGLEVSAYA
jgi:hypothetical protein